MVVVAEVAAEVADAECAVKHVMHVDLVARLLEGPRKKLFVQRLGLLGGKKVTVVATVRVEALVPTKEVGENGVAVLGTLALQHRQ